MLEVAFALVVILSVLLTTLWVGQENLVRERNYWRQQAKKARLDAILLRAALAKGRDEEA